MPDKEQEIIEAVDLIVDSIEAAADEFGLEVPVLAQRVANEISARDYS